MSFKHTLLGLLNLESMSGYEIKKIIQKTPFMYWSGNNNQVYTALADLLAEGHVSKEVQHQDGTPSKKVYTITEDGLEELNGWLISDAEAPVLRKQILIKLALSSHLTRDDLESMLESYARLVRMEMALAERQLEQSGFSELPSERAFFLSLIRENIVSLYSSELVWIDKVRQAAAALPASTAKVGQEENQLVEVKNEMNFAVREKDKKKFLHVTGDGGLLNQEQDALDIISQCFALETNAVVFEGQLSENFLQLSTGVAGAVLQKFGNYNIRAAFVLQEDQDMPLRFREMMTEQRAGNAFKIFDSMADATRWILVS
ncbi:MAG: DUF4180 domain-containing protein [Candidatus Wallacebacter cryptica]